MDETYFTFPDGSLRYDCAACGQACCRGHGIAAGDELLPLLRHAPALAAHVTLRPGGSFALHNLAEGCWLLGRDGFCAVEREAGRAQKPVTCRLFPFNRVYRVGGVRVVDVNSHLCPVEAARGAGGVRHADLEAEMGALAGSPLLDVPAPSPPGLPGDWLARERAHAEAALRLADDPDALASANGFHGSEARARRWAALYGLDEPARLAAERRVAPSVALLSGSLRWNTLFAKEARDHAAVAATLAGRLRALVFLGALATRSADGTPPTLRALTHLHRSQSEILETLAAWDQPAPPPAARFDADVPGPMMSALARFLGLAFRGGRTVGELIEAAAEALPACERPLVVALAAHLRTTDTLAAKA